MSSPEPSPHWLDNPQALVVCPADEVFGLTRSTPDGGPRRTTLEPGEAAHGADGLPAPGLLFLLADSVIGGATLRILGMQDVIVTSSLHLELHARPFEAHPAVSGVGGAAYRYHGGAASAAPFTSNVDGGEVTVATASGRFAVLPVGSRTGGNITSTGTTGSSGDTPRTPARDTHPLLAAPIHHTLGSRMLEVGADQLTMTFTARPELANERQGLHGGCGALMGERACAALIASVTPEGTDMRPISMSVAFFRPIAADGATIACTARVEHLGRSLIAVRAILLTPTAKPAVVVDVVAAGVPRQA